MPHLFLYGDADVLVDPANIEVGIEALKKHGFDVTKKIFTGSPHVGHFGKFEL